MFLSALIKTKTPNYKRGWSLILSSRNSATISNNSQLMKLCNSPKERNLTSRNYEAKESSIWLGRRSFSDLRNVDKNRFDVSDEVAQGIVDGKPIVALESTIITHGMPYPKNLETAVEVEQIVRNQGGVPATIAVIDGQVSVGLDSPSLSRLAEGIPGAVKISRRDMPRVLALGYSGGTTVSGTMVIAARMGIHVFVTGGIGGVHRYGESTMDVSADLTELGRTPVCVVSSGVKSILDIGRTLEYLETQGVCVVTYGDNTEFPAFYSRRSGYQSPGNVSTASDAARMVKFSMDLCLCSGLLVAVPVPEEYSLDEQAMEKAIQKALKSAEKQGIKGKDVTPFILAAVAEITEGRSLKTNIALIKNNAKIGTQIAVELNKLKNNSPPTTPDYRANNTNRFKTIQNVNEKVVRKPDDKVYFNTKGEQQTTFSNSPNENLENKDDSTTKYNTLKIIETSGFGSNSKVETSKRMSAASDVVKPLSPVVIGGTNVDYTIKVLEDDIKVSSFKSL